MVIAPTVFGAAVGAWCCEKDIEVVHEAIVKMTKLMKMEASRGCIRHKTIKIQK